MRQILFDTETTGLEPELGHRIIEIGAIEIVNRRRTGRQFHRYLCPDRDIDPGAVQVHGLTTEFLGSQPRFADVVAELREFIAGAELVIHNAPFDVAFSMPSSSCSQRSGRTSAACACGTCARCSTRSRSRARCTPASATASTRSASAIRSTTRTATCTARCSTPTCCSRSTSP